MATERRASPRRPAALYFNKYIDGHPYVAEAISLSSSGMLVRKIHEPDAPRASYALELASTGGELLWICARSIWSSGPFEALGFIDQSPIARARLTALIAAL